MSFTLYVKESLKRITHFQRFSMNRNQFVTSVLRGMAGLGGKGHLPIKQNIVFHRCMIKKYIYYYGREGNIGGTTTCHTF